MNSTLPSHRILYAMPLFVLIFTRLVIELCAHLLPMRLSWIPSFGIYYASIELCVWFAKKNLGITLDIARSKLNPFPKFKLFLFGIIIPALIPFGVFISNYQAVPLSSVAYIFVFAAINPFFEESFWRGMFINLPISPMQLNLVSGALFSFSHYFLWGAYWLANPRILIPTCVTTFIMGYCWMWFYQKDKRLIYPIMSHIVVDIFNLSIAVFLGLRLANT
ncbi:CPBP family intramembrane metalloprotease [Mucilaginibacter pallidiroseus]|uniref:CPBP family intramembrane metalloprotease n=1 Tax=Mucilaginibacter pallidiroseus TaxID=2599295 RepID=A0A563U184_9SPHI|nr:CPBP family intramembrane glutamic endopeptidase [Mucilaginibacter pallidiroseus]TWR24802.1 CPBP family intramembrane metalloprotease [Mucilaginibacter pallidiroseus]